MISALFNAELATVGQTFSYAVEPSWGENEWQVSGWSITGGSDEACEHGASEALHALGFRFWTPFRTTRPDSVPAGGVTLARQQLVMPYMSIFYNYGLADAGLQASFDRWRKLNNVDDTRRPVGHTWGTIINWANAQNNYYTNNPELLINDGVSFSVTDPGHRAANLAKCVEYLLTTINEHDRASFDPNDGDLQSSDVVFGFANDVVADLRMTRPNALLGLYAYAGHRAPASFPCPHLYVQVALGFNHLGIGYQALVQQWGAVAGEVALRGYGDIAAQDGWLPVNSAVTVADHYTSEYPGYIASGANGINLETSGNWCKNIVGQWHAIRFWKTGAGTYESAAQEIVDKIFDGNSNVLDLFLLWSGGVLHDGLTLESCRLVDAMPDTEYRAEFRRYLTFAMTDMKLTRFADRGGRYMALLEKNLRWAWGMRNAGTVHAYAYARQLANSNTTNNGRPDLSFNASPHWQRYPALPNDADFAALRDEVESRSGRFAELSDPSLVVVDVAPTGAAAANTDSATDYYTLGPAQFCFVGPGQVSIVYEEAFRGTELLSFGAGLHDVRVQFDATTSWTGGMLFLSAFPQVRLDPSTGQRWAYIPKIAKGRIRISSSSRVTLYDYAGRKDIHEGEAPFSEGMHDPQTLQPGVCRVDNINTRGTHRFWNINPFISPSPWKQLIPRALAVAEFPGLVLRA